MLEQLLASNNVSIALLVLGTAFWVFALWQVFASGKFRNKFLWAALCVLGGYVGAVIVIGWLFFGPKYKRPAPHAFETL